MSTPENIAGNKKPRSQLKILLILIDSENFHARERLKSVNAESSDGEEGESKPESQSSSNTRDQIYRLHHVILLN